jgi:hypothetical protein
MRWWASSTHRYRTARSVPTCNRTRIALDGEGNLAPGTLFMLADIILARIGLDEVAADRRIATSNLHLDMLFRPRSTVAPSAAVAMPPPSSMGERGVERIWSTGTDA